MGIFNKKYKFTDKKISRGGIVSSLFALTATVLLYAAIYISYRAHGSAGTRVGVLGASALVASLVGFIIGIRSFKNDTVFLGFPWFGVVGNAIIWLFVFGLLLIGL